MISCVMSCLSELYVCVCVCTPEWVLMFDLSLQVELDYLFHPEDSQAESFGLLGFLNPLDTLIENEGEKDPEDGRLYETGILLYYKERLVKRMFVPFPAHHQLLQRFGQSRCRRTTPHVSNSCTCCA